LAEWLVRLPKAGRSAFDYEIQQQYWQTAMRPLFADENLVEQVLGVLGGDESDDIVGSANDILARLDASSGRRADFLGSRVAETKQMMCVEDMRPREFPSFLLWSSTGAQGGGRGLLGPND
jgi:inositol-pentakisphosphate 2-kinase